MLVHRFEQTRNVGILFRVERARLVPVLAFAQFRDVLFRLQARREQERVVRVDRRDRGKVVGRVQPVARGHRTERAAAASQVGRARLQRFNIADGVDGLDPCRRTWGRRQRRI